MNKVEVAERCNNKERLIKAVKKQSTQRLKAVFNQSNGSSSKTRQKTNLERKYTCKEVT